MTARIKRMKPFRVTRRWLRDRLACYPQLQLFKEHFGAEVLVTELIIRKHFHEFAWVWLVSRKFGDDALYALEDAYRPLIEKAHRDREKIYEQFRFTRSGNYRKEFDNEAYQKAIHPIAVKRDRDKLTALIKVLREYSPED